MRDFRRLPPLLRVAGITGLLLALAAIALLGSSVVTSLSPFPRWSAESSRAAAIGYNLALLGQACSLVVQTSSARFRRPGYGPSPLDSWQSQVRAIVLLAALPICALALALFAPPSPFAFLLVAVISLLAVLVLLAAFVRAAVGAKAMV